MENIHNTIHEIKLKQLEKLKGGYIFDVVLDVEDDEIFYGLQILFDDKQKDNGELILWFLKDDEGNGAGAWEIDEPRLN